MSKIVKITTLGEGSKSAYDAANTRYFVANRFRTTITEGQYALVITNSELNEVEKDKDGNNKLDENGKVIPTGKKFTREEIAMVGDFKTVVIAKNEPAILAGLEAAIIAAESKKMAAGYTLEGELAGAAAAAGK